MSEFVRSQCMWILMAAVRRKERGVYAASASRALPGNQLQRFHFHTEAVRWAGDGAALWDYWHLAGLEVLDLQPA